MDNEPVQHLLESDKTYLSKEMARTQQAVMATQNVAKQALDKAETQADILSLNTVLRSVTKLQKVDVPRLRKQVDDLEAFRSQAKFLVRE